MKKITLLSITTIFAIGIGLSLILGSDLPIVGICGDANGKQYSHSVTEYGLDSQCSDGISSNKIFPPKGESVTWVCKGTNEENNSPTCSASRKSDPVSITGKCGNANGKIYSHLDVSYGSETQCSQGLSSDTDFPLVGKSVIWICKGSNGGDSPYCESSVSLRLWELSDKTEKHESSKDFLYKEYRDENKSKYIVIDTKKLERLTLGTWINIPDIHGNINEYKITYTGKNNKTTLVKSKYSNENKIFKINIIDGLIFGEFSNDKGETFIIKGFNEAGITYGIISLEAEYDFLDFSY